MTYYIGLRGTTNYWHVAAKTASEARAKLKERLGITSDGYLIAYRKQPSGLPIDFI